jgi:hypothetical protein
VLGAFGVFSFVSAYIEEEYTLNKRIKNASTYLYREMKETKTAKMYVCKKNL